MRGGSNGAKSRAAERTHPRARRVDESMNANERVEWLERLQELCARVCAAVQVAIEGALRAGRLSSLGQATRQGMGDTTFALDEHAEQAVEQWFQAVARERPLSLLTEDSGWRHRGPKSGGGWVELAGFDHGGPRIALDPIDGTRNLMADLRSAWSVVSCAGPGPGLPRLSELVLGMVSELPDSRAGVRRALWAYADGPCRFAQIDLASSRTLEERALVVDADGRADHGYFPFFRYGADLRPFLGSLERGFFERLRRFEGAQIERCFDDQYISNAGQLVLLSLGTYRAIFDLRALLAGHLGIPSTTSKPYDIAGAVLCAQRAGCVVEGPPRAGAPAALDFPLDCVTRLDFVGWTNAATRARLLPHLSAALAALGVRGSHTS